MTCIVGIVDHKKSRVFIGGDSAGVNCNSLDISTRNDAKVFKIGKFVIGCTSSFRMIQLIRFELKPGKVGRKDLFSYMCTDFIDKLRRCLKKGGFTTIDKSVETGGTFLVGYEDRLFAVYDDFQVSESANYYEACGSGEDFAKGAMAYLQTEKMRSEDKIEIALEIACRHNAGVRGPFIIESTDRDRIHSPIITPPLTTKRNHYVEPK